MTEQKAETGGANVAGDVHGNVITGYTIAQHEAALARQERRIRRDLKRAHTAEKALLQRQLDEVRRRAADLEGSFETRRTELAAAQAALQELGGLPQAKLDAAVAALGEGETGKAEALFAQVQAMEAAGIARAATAAYERGKLAESEVRWADAATHYATAARLAPNYRHLLAARRMAWRSDDYKAALRFGEDLLKAAVAEHGERSADHALALNEHAVTLAATGRYPEAELLYRDALAIDENTIGKADPDHATHLNNFAELLRVAGRYAEAEPLYREALALGTTHPNYAIWLNNLAALLGDTGRDAEAEPLYREALAIGEQALGKAHPDYATRLNNLAELLRGTGRYEEAEPLHREALAIREKALGRTHAYYAQSLNNLALLLDATGRYAEAEPLYREGLAINEKALGADHPVTRSLARNLALFEAEKQARGTAG